MYLLVSVLVLGLIWPALGTTLPARPHRGTATTFNPPVQLNKPLTFTTTGISHTLLTNFTLMAQYAATAGCNANSNSSSIGNPIYCDVGNCPLIDETDTEILYSFSANPLSFSSPTGFIAADHTHRTLLLLIRNTDTSANFYTDFEILQVDASATCPRCRAHMGFWLAAAAAKNELVSPLMEAMVRYPTYRLVFTGHSLGGAVAGLFAVWWRGQGVSVDLYTFGAPSIGNYAFAAFLTDDWRDLGSTYRITHLNDIVPKILYRMHRQPITGILMPEYSQSSPEYWITAESGEAVNTRDVVVVNGVNSERGNLGGGSGSMMDHMWYLGGLDVCSE